jgi:hypothetical protein
MSRYVSRHRSIRPRGDWDDDTPMLPSLEVPEHEEAFTGLLDAVGNEIWRQPRPVGFGRDKEWG